MRCISHGCHHRAVHEHHVVYQQHVVRAGGRLDDKRNLVPLCQECHFLHHGRSRPIALERLPTAAFQFAGELLGAAGFDYLRRRYSGEDPRLGVLLELAA